MNKNQVMKVVRKSFRSSFRKELEEAIIGNEFFGIFSCGGYSPWQSHYVIGETVDSCGGVLVGKVRGEDEAQAKAWDQFSVQGG